MGGPAELHQWYVGLHSNASHVARRKHSQSLVICLVRPRPLSLVWYIITVLKVCNEDTLWFCDPFISEDRSRFLRFVTGRSRLPAPIYIFPDKLGYSHLYWYYLLICFPAICYGLFWRCSSVVLLLLLLLILLLPLPPLALKRRTPFLSLPRAPAPSIYPTTQGKDHTSWSHLYRDWINNHIKDNTLLLIHFHVERYLLSQCIDACILFRCWVFHFLYKCLRSYGTNHYDILISGICRNTRTPCITLLLHTNYWYT